MLGKVMQALSLRCRRLDPEPAHGAAPDLSSARARTEALRKRRVESILRREGIARRAAERITAELFAAIRDDSADA